jgi:hypothetical protein
MDYQEACNPNFFPMFNDPVKPIVSENENRNHRGRRLPIAF